MLPSIRTFCCTLVVFNSNSSEPWILNTLPNVSFMLIDRSPYRPTWPERLSKPRVPVAVTPASMPNVSAALNVTSSP